MVSDGVSPVRDFFPFFFSFFFSPHWGRVSELVGFGSFGLAWFETRRSARADTSQFLGRERDQDSLCSFLTFRFCVVLMGMVMAGCLGGLGGWLAGTNSRSYGYGYGYTLALGYLGCCGWDQVTGLGTDLCFIWLASWKTDGFVDCTLLWNSLLLFLGPSDVEPWWGRNIPRNESQQIRHCREAARQDPTSEETNKIAVPSKQLTSFDLQALPFGDCAVMPTMFCRNFIWRF